MVGVGVIFAWIVTYFFLAPSIIWLKKYFPEVEKTGNIIDKKDIPVGKLSIKSTALIQKFKLPIILITICFFIFGVHFGGKLEVNMDPMEQFAPQVTHQ